MNHVSTDAAPVILIVDDDRNTRESLGRALRRDGYEVLVAEHGKAALALAQDHHVDLVLTDLKMPGLDGLDLIESLLAAVAVLCALALAGRLLDLIDALRRRS